MRARLAGAILAAVSLWAPARGQAADAAAIEAIRAKLVALDIEGTVAAVDALLAKGELPDATRVEALDLRAQAHVAGGELDAAERDFRAILPLRPDYAPRAELFGKKGMERFGRVQASMVGTVHVDRTPPDASLVVDGRPVAEDTPGTFKAIAGERSLRVERKGYDAAEVAVRAVAGRETLVKVDLVPNARDIIVLTDIPGVTVALDGVAIGSTAATQAGPGAPAELLIPDVGMGEHAIRLGKSCFAEETLQAMVRVDLADRSPERLRLATMRPARARVSVSGANYPGELRVDGERAASLPLDTFTMCPGRRELEVVASGRTVWSGAVEAGEADMTLDLSPRPSCALVGAEWPKGWSAAASAWSLRGRADLPVSADLTTAAGWKGIELPPGTDLALAVVPRAGIAGDDRELLYSPALGVVEDRVDPPASGRSAWGQPTVGADFVDTSEGVLVAHVTTGGPAALVGLQPADRVLAINARRIVRAADVRAALAPGKLVFEVTSAGATRTIDVVAVEAPRLGSAVGPGESAAVRAAWAAADAAAGGPHAPEALADLATLLERAGRDRVALEAWRRARAMAHVPEGIAARADYALGAAGGPDAVDFLQRARREADAAGNAALAAAAADRLADLGVPSR